MDLPLDISSGTSSFRRFMRRRILACQRDRRHLQRRVFDLEDRVNHADEHLQRIQAEVGTIRGEMFNCIEEKVDMAWRCAKMKIYLEKAFGAQGINELWGADESSMIGSEVPGAPSADILATAERHLKNIDSMGMSIKLTEEEVKLLPREIKSCHPELLKSSKMPPMI